MVMSEKKTEKVIGEVTLLKIEEPEIYSTHTCTCVCIKVPHTKCWEPISGRSCPSPLLVPLPKVGCRVCLCNMMSTLELRVRTPISEWVYPCRLGRTERVRWSWSYGGGFRFKTTEMIQRKMSRVVLYRRNPVWLDVCKLSSTISAPFLRKGGPGQSMDLDSVATRGGGWPVLAGGRGFGRGPGMWEEDCFFIEKGCGKGWGHCCGC